VKIDEKARDSGLIGGSSRRAEFQEFLDDQFPLGAMCAVITLARGHIEATTQIATGRLLCGSVEEDDGGRLWFEVVIDSRGSASGNHEVVTLWVRAPRQLGSGGDLWEADVKGDAGANCLLRLNADPPDSWRPTPEMRTAVTEFYAGYWPTTTQSR